MENSQINGSGHSTPPRTNIDTPSTRDIANDGLLSRLSLEHRQLSQLVREARSAAPRARLDLLRRLATECFVRSKAAERVLIPAVEQVDLDLAESWRESHEAVLQSLRDAESDWTEDALARVSEALDVMTLVVDPQIFLTATVVSGCIFSAELGEEYREQKLTVADELTQSSRDAAPCPTGTSNACGRAVDSSTFPAARKDDQLDDSPRKSHVRATARSQSNPGWRWQRSAWLKRRTG